MEKPTPLAADQLVVVTSNLRDALGCEVPLADDVFGAGGGAVWTAGLLEINPIARLDDVKRRTRQARESTLHRLAATQQQFNVRFE